MAVDKKYEADVAAILSHRYDQGGTLWERITACRKGRRFPLWTV